jgi:hypothetical protein
VSSGADVMEPAGLDFQEGTARTEEIGFLGDNTYPYLRGRIDIHHRADEVDALTLDDFLEHFTGWLQPGGDEYDPAIDDTTALLGTERIEANISTGSTLEADITE